MSAPEQPESYCECLSNVLTDTTPYNSATCALCSKNKRPVDPPDDLVISSSAPDEGTIYWAFRNVKPFKKITEGQSMVNSSIKSIITKRQEREGIKQVVDQLDELSHARPGVEAAAASTEATQAEEGLGLDAPDSLQSSQNTPGDHEELYLPFASQHKLMCYMQQYLEGVCYEFGKRTMPEVLKKRDWDCAEAAQLESWMDEFTRRVVLFKGAIDEEAAVNLFRSLADVQRVAICRVRTDSAGVKKFLLDAVRLTQILGVGDSYMVMDQFRADVERTLGSMRDDEDHFRSQLRIRLLQFQRQREVIDVREKLALSEMEKGVGECQAKAGIEVLKRIKKAEEVLVIKTN